MITKNWLKSTKRTKSMLAVCWLMPALAWAQFFTFGVKAGANFSQLKTLELKAPRLAAGGMPVMSGGQIVYDFFRGNDQRTTGVVGGAFFRFGRTLFIQPELLISSKGGTVDLVQTGLATQQVRVKFSTFDIPLLLGIKLGPLRLNAGPVASLTISEDKSFKASIQRYTTQPIGDTFKQAVFGYQAGGGLSLSGLQLDLRYEGNLSDLSKIGIKTAGSDGQLSTKTSLWQITTGFAF